MPYKNVALVDTISYVKLNKFDQILLNKPERYELNSSKVYGLIQKEQVAGVAKIEDGHLYGYLVSNPECSFSVSVGKEKYPGVAFGKDYKTMVVKFIPKWAKIKEGDHVQTSGLDGIFFAHVPVGVVTNVSIEESYKVATVKVLADTMHPNIFLLILDPKPYLVSYYDRNSSFPDQQYFYENQPPLKDETNLTSIPLTNQTKEEHFDPTEFEIPVEEQIIQRSLPLIIPEQTNKPKPKPKPKSKPKVKAKPKVKPKPKPKPKVKAKPKVKPKPKPKPHHKKREPRQIPPPSPPTPKVKEKKKPSPFDILRVGI
jgi:rod shape-determining protein MreC